MTMKTNWQTKKLEEVLEYEQPTQYIVSSTSYKEDYETPVLTAGKSFILGKTKEKKGIFPAKDLPVIIFDDFTTATKFVDFPFKVKSSAMKILHPVKNISDAKFLFYIMQNISFDHTGIHKRYWISEYSKIEIPLPALAEQKRIVKKLDEVFEKVATAKENAETNLQNSKELFRSYLQSVFAKPGKDWEEKKLKEIGVTQTGLTPKTANKKYYGNFVPFITPADIDISGNGSVRYDSKGLSEEGLEVGRKIKKNSVLMVCIGATIGKVGFATREVSCNQQINTLTPFDGYDAKLFYYILSTKSFFNKVIKGSSQATLPIINKGKWENLSVSFPKSLSEQKTIVKKLYALSLETKKLEKIYEQKLTNLEELKKSVLQQAFTGKL